MYIDQKRLPVAEAVKLSGYYEALILVFGDAEAIYFDGEPPHNTFISRML